MAYWLPISKCLKGRDISMRRTWTPKSFKKCFDTALYAKEALSTCTPGFLVRQHNNILRLHPHVAQVSLLRRKWFVNIILS